MEGQREGDHLKRPLGEGKLFGGSPRIRYAGVFGGTGQRLSGGIRADDLDGDLLRRHGGLPGSAGHVRGRVTANAPRYSQFADHTQKFGKYYRLWW